MKVYNTSFKKKEIILALGPESAGNFSVFSNGKIYYSSDFGDLLEDKNFQKFKKAVLRYLQKDKIKPKIILTDLHPLYKTTIWGKKLARKLRAKYIQVQHHIAHIFSCYGEQFLKNNYELQITNSRLHDFIGIACDGTGYGLDEKIWGGEIFKISNLKSQISNLQIKRIGHLENQTMIGGDLAVREPARMLIAILAKIRNPKHEIRNSPPHLLIGSKRKQEKLNLLTLTQGQKVGGQEFKIQNSKFKTNEKNKNFIYQFIKKYYTKNQFELLYNQLQQNFNCQETFSTGRILDAVSILLGFCKNQRDYKHQPIDLLEKNSTRPYRINSKFKIQNSKFVLLTTPLFEYLTKNLHRDKRRLAATAQIYIAQGLHRIISNFQFPISKKNQNSPPMTKKPKTQNKLPIYFAGGIANNKIISEYLESKGVFITKKIPRGDAGISFGQIIYYALNESIE